jgi:transposase-like protein
MMQRRRYNKEFKSAAVYVARSGRSVNSVADVLGIPRRTLRGWINQNLQTNQTPRSQKWIERWFTLHLEVARSKSLKPGASISLQIKTRTAARDTRR